MKHFQYLSLVLILGVCLAQMNKDQRESLSKKEKFLLFGLGNDVENFVTKSSEWRQEKSLLNTFPFSDKINSEHADAHSHEHHPHHGAHGDHQTHDRIQLPVREQFSPRTSNKANQQRNTLFPFKSTVRQNDPSVNEEEVASEIVSEDTLTEEDPQKVTLNERTVW